MATAFGDMAVRGRAYVTLHRALAWSGNQAAADEMAGAADARTAHLFISKRTVDAHLDHIYAKLGISSRVELLNALQLTRASQP